MLRAAWQLQDLGCDMFIQRLFWLPNPHPVTSSHGDHNLNFHPRYRKCVGSPAFICHEKAIWKWKWAPVGGGWHPKFFKPRADPCAKSSAPYLPPGSGIIKFGKQFQRVACSRRGWTFGGLALFVGLTCRHLGNKIWMCVFGNDKTGGKK